MPRFLALATLLCAAPAAGKSFFSCGKATDSFKVDDISVTPDPPVKGELMTFHVKGTGNQDFGAGVVIANLDVKALGVINEQVQESSQFQISPSPVAAGAFEMTVGPFALPTNLPGSATIVGNVTLLTADQSGQVMCLGFDATLPGATEAPAPVVAEAPTTCGDPANDHVHSITQVDNETTSFALDEDLDSFSIDVDIQLQVAIFKIPLKLTIPIKSTPAIKAADKYTAKFHPLGGGADESNGVVSVTGEVKVTDSKAEEVWCTDITKAAEKTVVV